MSSYADAKQRGFHEAYRAFRAQLIFDALQETGWNKAEAARILRIPRTLVVYYVKIHKLEDPKRVQN